MKEGNTMLIIKKHNLHELKQYGFKESIFSDKWKMEPCWYLNCSVGITILVFTNEIKNSDFAYVRIINRDVDTYARTAPDVLLDLITNGIVEKEREN